MKITQEEVTHVANASKFKILLQEETAEFATTLSKIVDMVEGFFWKKWTQLVWLPTTTMADRKTVLRPDVAEKGRTVTVCLKNVPEKDNYYIKVPAIQKMEEMLMSFNHKNHWKSCTTSLVSKEISATELTQATLDDIKAREEAINAFVTVAEEAAPCTSQSY